MTSVIESIGKRLGGFVLRLRKIIGKAGAKMCLNTFMLANGIESFACMTEKAEVDLQRNR
jgi:hypothetical protein